MDIHFDFDCRGGLWWAIGSMPFQVLAHWYFVQPGIGVLVLQAVLSMALVFVATALMLPVLFAGREDPASEPGDDRG